MSYRLIDSNSLAIKYPEVNDMPCIFADLPNGLDNNHYTFILSDEDVNCLKCPYLKITEEDNN